MTINACAVWLDYQRRNRRAAKAKAEKWLLQNNHQRHPNNDTSVQRHLLPATSGQRPSNNNLNNNPYHICDPIGSSMTYGTCVSDVAVSVACIALWVVALVAAAVLLLTRSRRTAAAAAAGSAGRRRPSTSASAYPPSPYSAASSSPSPPPPPLPSHYHHHARHGPGHHYHPGVSGPGGHVLLTPTASGQQLPSVRKHYWAGAIFGQDLRWALTSALFCIHAAEICCLVLERRGACVQHSQFALPTLEALTAAALMGFYAVVERTAAPAASLALGTAYFLVDALCRAHKTSELLGMGYQPRHARIVLTVSACACMLALVLADVLLFVFKVDWPCLRGTGTRKCNNNRRRTNNKAASVAAASGSSAPPHQRSATSSPPSPSTFGGEDNNNNDKGRGSGGPVDLTDVRYLHPFSNLPSRLLFLWLNPFLRKGFADPLEVEDLGRLPDASRTRRQFLDFARVYETVTAAAGNKKPAGRANTPPTSTPGREDSDLVTPKQLWTCYLKFCCPTWLLGGALRLFTDLVGFVAPLSVNVILTYVAATSSSTTTTTATTPPGLLANDTRLMSDVTLGSTTTTTTTDYLFVSAAAGGVGPATTTTSAARHDDVIRQGIDHTSIGEFFHNGFVMMGVLFLGSILQSLLSQASTHTNNVTGIHLKLALLSMVYSKCLRRPIWEDVKGVSTPGSKEEANARPPATRSMGNVSVEPAGSINATESTVSVERQSLLLNEDEDPETGAGGDAPPSPQVKGGSSVDDLVKLQHPFPAYVDEEDEEEVRNEQWFVAAKESHGSVINLISEDVNNIMMFFWMGHYTWAIPLKVTIILCLLYTQLGSSSLVGAAISILVLTPIQMVLAKRISKVQKSVLDATDQRLRTLAEVIQNVKVVKMLHWEGIFKSKIERQRKNELELLWTDSILWALVGVIPQASSILVTLVTFGVYAQIEHEPLTSAKIFTGLALFNQMLVPLFILPITVNVVVKGVVSTRRLAEFFSTPSLRGRNQGHRQNNKLTSKNCSHSDFSAWSSLDPLGNDHHHVGIDEIRKIEKKLSFSDLNPSREEVYPSAEERASLISGTTGGNPVTIPAVAGMTTSFGSLRSVLRSSSSQQQLPATTPPSPAASVFPTTGFGVTPPSPSRKSLPTISGVFYSRQSSAGEAAASATTATATSRDRRSSASVYIFPEEPTIQEEDEKDVVEEEDELEEEEEEEEEEDDDEDGEYSVDSDGNGDSAATSSTGSADSRSTVLQHAVGGDGRDVVPRTGPQVGPSITCDDFKYIDDEEEDDGGGMTAEKAVAGGGKGGVDVDDNDDDDDGTSDDVSSIQTVQEGNAVVGGAPVKTNNAVATPASIDNQVQHSLMRHQRPVVEIRLKNADFSWHRSANKTDDTTGCWRVEIGSSSSKKTSNSRNGTSKYAAAGVSPPAVMADNGAITESDPVLRNVTLTIPDSKLTMIVGDVGSGKSSLLLALLNELAPPDERKFRGAGLRGAGDESDGAPCFPFAVAYVSQRPWLLNGSVKDNVLFGYKLNQKRYDHVIQATALQPDLNMMPDGDATDVGDAGVTLSGGQRQRIALARALYSTAPLVLLDNPVSSLDPQVAVKVFNRAIISYLSRQKRTVVMVTHRLQFLPNADHIIALDKGTVVAEGSYKEMAELHPKLFDEWKRRITLEEEEVKRREMEAQAARERWKMLKVVTKFGLRRSTLRMRHSSLKSPTSFQSSGSVLPLGFWLDTAESSTVINPFASSSHRLYLSRQVSHDCVLPSDEYEGDMSLHYMRPKGTFYTPQALLHQHHKLRAMASVNAAFTFAGPSLGTGAGLGGLGGNGAIGAPAIFRSRQATISGGSLSGPSVALRRPHPFLSSSLKKAAICKTLSTPISPMSAPVSGVDYCPSPTSMSPALIGTSVGGSSAPGGLPMGPGERLRLRPYSGPAQFPGDYNGPPARKGSTSLEVPMGPTSRPQVPPLLLGARYSSNRPMTPNHQPEISPFFRKSLLSRMLSTFSSRSGTGTPTTPGFPPTGPYWSAGGDPMMLPGSKLAVSKRDSSMSWHSDVTGITLDPSEVFADEEELEGLLSEEERKRGRVSVTLYSRYLKACGVFSGILYLFTACAAQAAKVLTDIWLSEWARSEDERASSDQSTSNANDEQPPSFSSMHLNVYAVLCVVSLVLVLLTHLSGQYAARRARMVLHKDLLDSILRAPMSFFDRMPVGRILNRFSTDTGVIDKELAPGIQRLLYFVLLCLSSIVVNAVVVPWFILAGIAILVVYYFLQHFFRATSRELQRLESQTRSPIYSLFSETLSGLTTIRAFKQEARFMSMALDRMDLNNAAFLLKEAAHRWLGVALDCLGAFIVLIACLASMLAWQRADDGEGDPAWVGLAINYTLLVPVYLAWVLKYAAEVEMHMAALEWIQMYTKIPGEDSAMAATSSPSGEGNGQGSAGGRTGQPHQSYVCRRDNKTPSAARGDVKFCSTGMANGSGKQSRDSGRRDDEESAVMLPMDSYKVISEDAEQGAMSSVIIGTSDRTRLLNWPSEGRLVLENVSVRYGPTLEPVLRNFTLRIEPGEKVGICGRTGSGKSTLLLSLLRMIECVDGSITVDGTDISAVPVELLRSKIATIPQDAVLFSGTIRSNLDPGGKMSDKKIWEALESVRVDDIVRSRPGGLDAEVGPGGCSFSSGEIQLLCLGRASCRQGARILLMDEASSALHPVAYARIQTALKHRFKRCTVLSVAHDFDTLKRFDRIVVLENGEIVEQGSPAELERKVGGHFAGISTAFSNTVLPKN